MNMVPGELPGVLIAEPRIFEDSRGFFMESWSRKIFNDAAGTVDFVQDNHSYSRDKGTIRGLHFQLPPMAQAKLVRVVVGSVWDVAVDLRQGSVTYGKWEALILSAKNRKQLFIPRGFAHGFCTLEPHTEILYKTDNFYSSDHDSGLAWDDPDLAIEWPERDPVLSDKDRGLGPLRNFTSPFVS